MARTLKIQKSLMCPQDTVGRQIDQHWDLNKCQNYKPRIERQKHQKNIQVHIASKSMRPMMKMFQVGTFGSFAQLVTRILADKRCIHESHP